jgi:hypothetical protein
VLGVVRLIESDATVVLVDFDVKVETEEAKVAHLEGGLHLSLEGLHHRFFYASDDEIIDVDLHH